MAGHVRWAVIAFAIGTGAACFSEKPPGPCPPGDIGCRCTDADECDTGLVCSQDFCVLDDCTLGTEFCNCDEGTCVGGLECFEGGVCLDTGGGSGGGEAGPTSAVAGSMDGEASNATGPEPSDSTQTACTPGEVCGECRRCDENGTCVVDVGEPCEGPELQCEDFLWGYDAGTCYRLQAATLGARCDAVGECAQASMRDCEVRQGEAHVVCEPECVDASGQCAAFAPAETVSVDSMCVEAGPGPDCTDICFNRTGSGIGHYACTAGICNHMGSDDCGAYACANLMCNDGCTQRADCAMFYICVDGSCVLP